jgi:1-acyl-sn-glycerol-3-phosphate acyltransferase
MSLLQNVCSVVRMTAFISSFAFIQIVSLFMAPLTFLNPFLRRCGVIEKNLPMNQVMPILARFVLFSSGVRLNVVDQSKQATSQVIYMYNHTSNLDPVIVMSTTACKFIYKKELMYVPIFGWAMLAYKHIAIDRKNRVQAIESLNCAVKNVVEKKQNVAIAPEGTRSKTGLLQEFKKGPFHMASQSHATIVPVVITGVFPILPPKSFLLTGGQVSVRLLPPVVVRDNESVEDLQERVHVMFVDALDAANKSAVKSQPHYLATTAQSIVSLFALVQLVTFVTGLFFGR